MTFVEVLCEGSSDVPVVREVLTRHFGLEQDRQFRIHPHRGKGKLPVAGAAPSPARDGLLTQLPIKLRNYGRQAGAGYETAVVVLVDADDDACRELKAALVAMYNGLDVKPRTLFRIAVEETESWFLADVDAVKKAYPRASRAKLNGIPPDKVCGAWERLADAIGFTGSNPGAGKQEWADAISPHLSLSDPPSPSLRAFVTGVAKLLAESTVDGRAGTRVDS